MSIENPVLGSSKTFDLKMSSSGTAPPHHSPHPLMPNPTSRIGGYIYPKFLIFSKSISQVSTTAKLDSLRFGRDWDS